MAELVYEILQDGDNDSVEVSAISERNDQLRRSLNPNAILLHTLRARSDFDVMQQMHDFLDFEPWAPRKGRTEQFFTDAEAEEQRRYIAFRDVS